MINFPFVPNGKLNIFRCPKFWAHYSLIVMCLNIGTLNNHHIPFGTNEQVVVLGVPELRHFRVSTNMFHRIWKDGLQLYVLVTVVQSYKDDGREVMKCCL